MTPPRCARSWRRRRDSPERRHGGTTHIPPLRCRRPSHRGAVFRCGCCVVEGRGVVAHHSDMGAGQRAETDVIRRVHAGWAPFLHPVGGAEPANIRSRPIAFSAGDLSRSAAKQKKIVKLTRRLKSVFKLQRLLALKGQW